MTKIAVFGAGTWGIALARLLAVHARMSQYGAPSPPS